MDSHSIGIAHLAVGILAYLDYHRCRFRRLLAREMEDKRTEIESKTIKLIGYL